MTSFADPGSGPVDTQRNATVNLNANIGPYSSQMNAAAQSTNRAAASVDALSSKLDGLSKRAGRKLELISASDIAALGGAAAGAVVLQKQLGTLNATSAITGVSMRGLKGDVESAFVKFPVARGQVVSLVEAISDLGVTSTRDIGTLTQTFIKLAAATGEPIGGLTTGLIQLSRLMGTTSASQIGNYANSLLTVSKNAGVSATGVLNFAQAIAPMARQAGIGEAAVLGISAAFTKAGADGYVAANTFNSIVSDITNLSRTGSPDLAKYATAVGDTVGQFKALSGQQQITAIFNTISQNGPRALALVNQLGLGTRALSAVQAVSQSGGLNAAIAQATGASTNQNNLNKGSAAAFNNVADSLERLRNEFTQVGTEIGTTFLTPLTKVLSVMASIGAVAGAIIKPFTPLLAVLGTVAGLLGTIAGVGLVHAGAIGTLALGRLALNNGVRRSYNEGQAGSMNDEQVDALPLRGRAAYRVGSAVGPRGLLGFGGLGARLGATRVGSRFAAGFSGAADEAEEGGPGIFRQMGRAALLAAPRTVGYFAGNQTRTMRDSQLNDFERSAYTGEGKGGGIRGFVSNNAANTEAMGSVKAFTAATLDATKALGVMAVETGKAGFAAAGAGLRAGVGRLPGLAGMAASGVGSALSFGGKAISAAGSALFSLPGLVASIAGPEIISAFRNKASAANDPNADLNPIQQYNNQLGIATTKLATFSDSLASSASQVKGLNGVTSSTPLSTATTVSKQDIASASGKSTDKNLTAIAQGPRTGAQARTSLTTLAQTYDMTDPQQVQLFKINALRSGFQPSDVSAALTTAAATATSGAQGAINFGSLGARAGSSEGIAKGKLGFLGSTYNPSGSGQALQGTVQTQLQLGYVADQQSGGDAYARQRQLAGGLSYLSSFLGQGKANQSSGPANKAFGDAVKEFFGGSSQDYQKALLSQFGSANFKKMSDTDRQKAILAVINSTPGGSKFLSGLSGEGVNVNNPGDFSGSITSLYGKGPRDATVAQLNAQGPLGKFLTTNSAVANSVNNPANPAAGLASSQTLFTQGILGLGQNTNQLVNKFSMLEAAAGDLTSGLGLAASGAAAYARQQQSYQTPYQSREGQLQTAASNYQGSAAALAAAGPNAPQALVDQFTGDQQAYEQSKASYQQYLIGMYQQLQAYQTQSERASQDYNLQVFRAQQAFQIQEQQSEQDYQRQRYRTIRDYNTQLKNEAATAAQTIYSPFSQIQSQYTLDAGDVAENLQNQNDALTKQNQQLKEAKKLGLSTQSIQELDLSDPANAQELNSLVESLMQDPKLARTINTEIAQRLKATTSLTQSQFALEFVQSQNQFQVQLHDTAQDFQTAQDRAVQAQSIALGQMAQDYGTMVTRSAQDLSTAMTQLFGSFGDEYSKTLSKISTALGGMNPDLKKLLTSQIRTAEQVVNSTEDAATSAAEKVVISNLEAILKNAEVKKIIDNLDKTGGVGNAGRLYLLIGDLDETPGANHASGGIATKRMSTGNWGEAGPEAMIPLNSRGQNFMAGMIANSLAQGIVMAGGNGGGLGSSRTYQDYSTTYSGDISVAADDPRAMERQLAARKRVRMLTQPARTG